MYKKNLLDYFNSRVASLEQHFTLALESREPEGIHQVRVENKRLRAFFCIVESINPGFKAGKKFADFKRLSKSGAQQRDAFVQLELCDEVTGAGGFEFPAYRNFILQKEESGWRMFREFAADFNISGLYKKAKALELAAGEIPGEQARERSVSRLDSMGGELAGLKDRSLREYRFMHQIRILSKETHFTALIIQEIFPDCGFEAKFLDVLKKTHQVLGLWHDCEICNSYLKEFAESRARNPDRRPLEIMREKVLERKNRLTEEFSKIPG